MQQQRRADEPQAEKTNPQKNIIVHRKNPFKLSLTLRKFPKFIVQNAAGCLSLEPCGGPAPTPAPTATCGGSSERDAGS